MTGPPPPDPRTRRDTDGAATVAPLLLLLPDTVRYVHEPLVRDSAVPILGHAEIIDELVDHLDLRAAPEAAADEVVIGG
ncbi:MAG TPA: hypothetical protein VG478_02325 [Acidimicrobiales bacterium]|jgi:hypothetical protein|nr:hypothetical protein [Acidimicrobiales bacterium]